MLKQLRRKFVLINMLLVSLVLERSSGKRVTQGLYVSSDEEHERIGFLFSLEGEEQPVHRVTSFSAYHKASAIVEFLLPPDGGDFLLVDESFARRLFERYRTGRDERQEEQPEDQAAEQAEGEEQAESTDRRE